MATIRKIALPIIGAFGLLCMAAPAIAQQQEIVVTSKMKIPKGFEPVKKVVNIKDLNLVTSADERKMERRVRAAVVEICPVPARPARWQLRDAKLCSDFAWAGARPQMAEALRKARD